MPAHVLLRETDFFSLSLSQQVTHPRPALKENSNILNRKQIIKVNLQSGSREVGLQVGTRVREPS